MYYVQRHLWYKFYHIYNEIKDCDTLPLTRKIPNKENNYCVQHIKTGLSLQLCHCVPTAAAAEDWWHANAFPWTTLIRSIREVPNTTAGITQCHAATHTWALSSPGLSGNRDKQHQICADSALHGPGLLQDRTQGWLASLHMSLVSNQAIEYSYGWLLFSGCLAQLIVWSFDNVSLLVNPVISIRCVCGN